MAIKFLGMTSLRVRRLIKGTPKRARIVSLFILVCFGALFQYYTMGIERSIVVSGNTEVAKIKLTRETRWSFANIILCAPIPRKRSSLVNSQDKWFDGKDCQSSHKVGEGRGTVTWPVGASIFIRRRAMGVMEFLFEIEADDQSLEASVALVGVEHKVIQRSRIIVPMSDVINVGALDFIGSTVFGHSVNQGANAIFVSGEYEIREQLPFRHSLQLIRNGRLFRGDKVTILNSEKGNDELSGFISASGPEDIGFNFVASATSKNSSGSQQGVNLKVARHGGVPVSIGTRWTDRALSDSLTLAISAILGALAVLITIIVELYGFFRSDNKRNL